MIGHELKIIVSLPSLVQIWRTLGFFSVTFKICLKSLLDDANKFVSFGNPTLQFVPLYTCFETMLLFVLSYSRFKGQKNHFKHSNSFICLLSKGTKCLQLNDDNVLRKNDITQTTDI